MKRFVLLQDLLMIDDCPGFALLLIFQGNRPRGEIKEPQQTAAAGSITPGDYFLVVYAFFLAPSPGTTHRHPLTRNFAMRRSRVED